MEALGLSILVRDVPGGPLVTMPPAEEFDNVPAPFRAWNADSCHKRKYRRDPLRNDSAAPAS
jgi:hypothetical protein